jgi:hypothetical protein
MCSHNRYVSTLPRQSVTSLAECFVMLASLWVNLAEVIEGHLRRELAQGEEMSGQELSA